MLILFISYCVHFKSALIVSFPILIHIPLAWPVSNLDPIATKFGESKMKSVGRGAFGSASSSFSNILAYFLVTVSTGS